MPFEVRRLAASDIELLRRIDRSEQLQLEFRVEGGDLVAEPTDFFVPAWKPNGTGPHSVGGLISFWRPYAEAGAQLLGAYFDEDLAGIALVERSLRPDLGWLALLYTSSPFRRRGVGKALWAEALTIVRDAGAAAMYVSAAPTDSAVGFYLAQGCRLATRAEIVPELFEIEPEDIHLICPL